MMRCFSSIGSIGQVAISIMLRPQPVQSPSRPRLHLSIQGLGCCSRDRLPTGRRIADFAPAATQGGKEARMTNGPSGMTKEQCPLTNGGRREP